MLPTPMDSPPCEAGDEPATCACSERVAVLEQQVAVLWGSLHRELSRVSLYQTRLLDSGMEGAAMGMQATPDEEGWL